MSQPAVVPWRAGRRPGESPQFPAGVPSVSPLIAAASPTVLMGDISQYQPDIDDAVYVQKFSRAAIFRAMYGTVIDSAWYGGARRSGLHTAGAQFVGIYQYVVAAEDALSQADALGELLGSLQPGEKVIADIEEGSGSQQARWEIWANRVAQLKNDPWDYSGMNFAASHGLQPVDWVAAYQSLPPAVPHKLWQFTDSYDVPGVAGAIDCSVWDGTMAELLTYAYGAPPVPSPPVPPVEENNMPGGVIAVPISAYPISFEVGTVHKIVFYASAPANVTVNIAHGGGGSESAPGSIYNAGTLDVHPRAEYVITNYADVDAIVLTDVTGPVGWHTE